MEHVAACTGQSAPAGARNDRPSHGEREGRACGAPGGATRIGCMQWAASLTWGWPVDVKAHQDTSPPVPFAPLYLMYPTTLHEHHPPTHPPAHLAVNQVLLGAATRAADACRHTERTAGSHVS